ncbi:MAG: hypothetical protein WC554_04015 [Clostridia bacterium]|jgi:hypothetical protein
MKTSTILIAAGLAAVGIYFITKKSGASDEVPQWYTASTPQIDSLRGSGFTEAQIADWNEVAYARVFASLQPGYIVSWSDELGYYAKRQGMSASVSQHGYNVPSWKRNLPDIYYRKINAEPNIVQDPPYIWPYEPKF